MKNNLHSRIIIHDILLAIKKNLSTYDELFNRYTKAANLNTLEKKFIHNTILTCLRNHATINDIIYKYSNKKQTNIDQYLILLSGITQLVYLNIKDHAVIHSMVEISKDKKFKSNPSYVNAILRKVLKNKDILKLANANFNSLPQWFLNQTKEWNKKTKFDFLETIRKQPDIHLVFKSSIKLKKSNLEGFETSMKSISLKNIGKIENLHNYKLGDWWVQDYSTMLPISLLVNTDNKESIDMCSAPGGKSFQLLSNNVRTTLYEKSRKRIEVLKTNLNRLDYNPKIILADVLEIDETKKFDIVILDSPCSAVGTIRRNPEIFFRNEKVDLEYYVEIQKKMLEKASKIVKKNGLILYMVCSFLKIETNIQIDKFLKKNKNFSLEAFDIDKNKLVNKRGYIKTIPKEIDSNFLIDGFFAAKLLRND